MSYETRYAAAKRTQEDARANSPEAVAWRLRDNAIRARVVLEREAKYPTLTPDNFAEAMDWQEARIRELHAAT